MALECDKSFAYNKFIFNWVKNYDDQINSLIDRMESLQNKVYLHNHLTYGELTRAIEKLTHANCELFNYIVIIILDNECEYANFITTSDKQNVLLYSEILTHCTGMDNENGYNIGEVIKLHQTELKKSAVLYPGLTIYIKGYEYSNNFTGSILTKVFSRYLSNYANKLPMDKIHKGMLKEIKYLRGYRMNIEFGSNETTEANNFLQGNGICGDVLRDFF